MFSEFIISTSNAYLLVASIDELGDKYVLTAGKISITRAAIKGSSVSKPISYFQYLPGWKLDNEGRGKMKKCSGYCRTESLIYDEELYIF